MSNLRRRLMITVAATLLLGALPAVAGAAVTAPATSIAGGKEFACALDPTASLVCWGTGAEGELDPPAGTFTAVTDGRYHACALTPEKSIVCWTRPCPRSATPTPR